MPGYDASAWQMIVAPAKTPPEIVGKLNAELNAIVSEPELSREINGRGSHRDRDAAAGRARALRQVGDRALGQGGGAGRRDRIGVSRAGQPRHHKKH